MSRFGLRQAADGSYYVVVYDNEQASTPTDSTNDMLVSSASNFELDAANGHPYPFGDFDTGNGICPPIVAPVLGYAELYPGETNDGWVCSAPLDPQDYAQTFTLTYYNQANIPAQESVPVVNLTVTIP